jgi:hypothetical protein
MDSGAVGGYFDLNPLMNAPRPSQPYSFARGGYTGDGGKYDVAGFVHRGEYVVPQNGALVVRGDSTETVSVLRDILRTLNKIEAMGPGRVNATIHTNAPQVATRQIFSAKDRIYGTVA